MVDSYAIFGFARHATILRAERVGAGVAFLPPDLIYGDGCYARIAELVTNEPRAAFGLGRNRHRLFEKPIAYPTRTPPIGPVVSEEEAKERLTGVRKMFEQDPILVDVAEEQEVVRKLYYGKGGLCRT